MTTKLQMRYWGSLYSGDPPPPEKKAPLFPPPKKNFFLISCKNLKKKGGFWGKAPFSPFYNYKQPKLLWGKRKAPNVFGALIAEVEKEIDCIGDTLIKDKWV